MARGHSRREWGRAKTETLQASLPDFCFFLPIPACFEQSEPICDEIRQKHLKNWMYWRRLF